MRNADLYIDGDSIPPGEYFFTLVASKGEQKSEANATVVIVPDEVPNLEILAIDRLVQPYKKFVATALITGEIPK